MEIHLLILFCAFFALACAGPPKPIAAPPPKPRLPAESLRHGCSSSQYRLVCGLPEGFVVTQQGPGPGTVLTLLKRSPTAAEGPGLKVRVIPLKGRTLKAFAAGRIVAPLSKAAGVSNLRVRQATLGGRAGHEVTLTRAYASGRVSWRIFCFRSGADAFIVEYTVPLDSAAAARPAKPEPDVLSAFVASFRFD
ncbi:MAG: hypothetical protein HY922_10195 [Elusimicrobia bacterium]|nr:hypothetical protein [Elusimicrobiota bacterium]